jgi:hypothetical protein
MVFLVLGFNNSFFWFIYFRYYNLSPSPILVYHKPRNLWKQTGWLPNFFKIEEYQSISRGTTSIGKLLLPKSMTPYLAHAHEWAENRVNLSTTGFLLCLCPLLWPILSCSHFVAILESRLDKDHMPCSNDCYCNKTPASSILRQWASWPPVATTYDHQNTPGTVTV